MYEVELKVELTDREKIDLIKSFKDQGFGSKGSTPQNDYYIEAKESPFGGQDLKRYRNENGKLIYTEKIWEMEGDVKARRENEYEVSKEIFEKAIAEFPNAIKIIKDREWFDASYEGVKISVTIDSVKFDHSPSIRYFVEAEIDVKDKIEVPKTKEFIVKFLKKILNKTEMMEAPGMFTMAVKKI